jgi:hypothetical protein
VVELGKGRIEITRLIQHYNLHEYTGGDLPFALVPRHRSWPLDLRDGKNQKSSCLCRMATLSTRPMPSIKEVKPLPP